MNFFKNLLSGYQRCMFIHIPKTAGASFNKMMIQKYGRKNSERISDKSQLIKFWEQEEIDLSQSKKYLSGHVPLYHALVSANPQVKFITWVREPVDRLISHYFYWHENAPVQNPRHALFTEKFPSIVDFIESKELSAEAFIYRSYLNYNINIFKEANVAIGFNENMGNDIHRISSFLGIRPVRKMPHTNKTKNRLRMDMKTIEKIGRLLQEEIKFYDALKSKYLRN